MQNISHLIAFLKLLMFVSCLTENLDKVYAKNSRFFSIDYRATYQDRLICLPQRKSSTKYYINGHHYLLTGQVLKFSHYTNHHALDFEITLP